MKKEGVLKYELELTPGSRHKKAVPIRVTNVQCGPRFVYIRARSVMTSGQIVMR